MTLPRHSHDTPTALPRGRQAWNVSLAQYDIELTPRTTPPPPGGRRRGLPLRRSFQLLPDHLLCATEEAGGGCAWSVRFASPPALVYLLDTTVRAA